MKVMKITGNQQNHNSLLCAYLSHFEFQISLTQDKFLEFLERCFFHWKFLWNEFFIEWSGGPDEPVQTRTHLYSILWKIRFEILSMKKASFQIVKEFILSLAHLKFEMTQMQQTSRKFFKHDMKMITQLAENMIVFVFWYTTCRKHLSHDLKIFWFENILIF